MFDESIRIDKRDLTIKFRILKKIKTKFWKIVSITIQKKSWIIATIIKLWDEYLKNFVVFYIFIVDNVEKLLKENES